MAEDRKKKKKQGPDWKMMIPGYGAGKAIYSLLKKRQMPEIRPEVRKVQPEPPPPKEPQAAQPPKKKKKEPRGGVGGVLDTIQERKRRMREMIEEE